MSSATTPGRTRRCPGCRRQRPRRDRGGREGSSPRSGTSPYLFRPAARPHRRPRSGRRRPCSGYARCSGLRRRPADYQDPGSAAVAARRSTPCAPGPSSACTSGTPARSRPCPTILARLARRAASMPSPCRGCADDRGTTRAAPAFSWWRRSPPCSPSLPRVHEPADGHEARPGHPDVQPRPPSTATTVGPAAVRHDDGAPERLYAHAGANALTGAALHAKRLVYVPNQVAGHARGDRPRHARVIKHVRVPSTPEHVVPTWDMRRLWVNSDKGDALTPIDPAHRRGPAGRSRSATPTTSTSPPTASTPSSWPSGCGPSTCATRTR